MITQKYLSKSHSLIKLLRPKQWIKNAFVLAPLLFSGAFVNAQHVKQAILATLLFCLAASSAYVLNDVKDAELDRLHPTKSKKRPIASGTLSKPEAIVSLITLYIALGFTCFFTSQQVAMVIAGYLLLNVAYTFWLKRIPVVDIFVIAFGFVLRVYAGGMALDVPVSSWMLITTLCLALYLASIKRKQELIHKKIESRDVLKEYTSSLTARYAEISATCSIVFYSLYVFSEQPKLVLSIPMVLFGLFRYWYLTERKAEGESPTDALLNDWQLLTVIALWVVTCAWQLTASSSI